jgi:uncharacterized membrane protein YfcA
MPLPAFPLVMVILFVSSSIRSTFGFGDALVAMPLLTLIMDFETATPLVALIAATMALAIVLQSRSQVQWRSAWRLIVSTMAGIPLGLALLQDAYEDLLKGLLAVVLIGFGLFSLIRPRVRRCQGEKAAFAFGFAAGILGGAYNTNGPPVVIYGTLKRWSPQLFRATLQGYFLPSSLSICIGHGLGGLWTAPVLQTYLSALPLVFLALFLGGGINRVLSPERFNRWIYGLLIVLGLTLLGRVLF